MLETSVLEASQFSADVTQSLVLVGAGTCSTEPEL
jgi:hypothetical protein